MADEPDHEKERQVVSDVLLHNSTYKGKAATIKRNTSGTVAATETPSTESAAAPSESAGESTAAETTAAETAAPTTAAPTTAAPSDGSNYGPGYAQETTAAPAETNQAPSDMGLIAPNGQ